MSVTSELFGKLADGTEISKYWIQNCNGMKVGIINYGAIITNLIVPTKNGDKDIVSKENYIGTALLEGGTLVLHYFLVKAEDIFK